MKTTLPKIVKFIKYHWRHCAVFDPAKIGQPSKHLFESCVSMGWHHAPGDELPPEQQCKEWLKRNGYVFEAEEPNCRERWVLA